MMGGDMMGGVAWLSVLVAIALIVLILVGLAWLTRLLGGDGRTRRTERRPIEELDLRYARGEVERDTYLVIRRDLEADGD